MIDAFPVILKTMRKEVFCFILTTFSFLCSLIFCTQSGYFIFELFNEYACGISLLFCLICELIFIPWVFGIEKLDILLQIKTGESIPNFVKNIIKFVLPIISVFMFILKLYTEFLPGASYPSKKKWP